MLDLRPNVILKKVGCVNGVTGNKVGNGNKPKLFFRVRITTCSPTTTKEHHICTLSIVAEPHPQQSRTSKLDLYSMPRPVLKKLDDPGVFSITCSINRIILSLCMCYLGASISVMPSSLARTLGLQNFRASNATVRLADQSTAEIEGILEDVPVMVDNIIIPTDFIVVDMTQDLENPLILRRHFLASTNALIDVTARTVKMRLGTYKQPIFTLNGDVIDVLTWDDTSSGSLESLTESDNEGPEEEKTMPPLSTPYFAI